MAYTNNDTPTGFINNQSDEEEIYDPPSAVTDLIETLLDSYKYETEENWNLSMEEFMCSDNCCYELSEIVERLNQCYCCKRHQTDRPKKLEKYVETEHKYLNKFHKCHCPCRHLVRFACRAEYGVYE